MILYINACVREDSRTDRLARKLLETLGGEYTERRLPEAGLLPLSAQRLALRNTLLEKGALDSEEFALAREFAAADAIVVGAPFWDLSFPSVLKTYVENIYITGIVSRYGENGMPVGLCRTKTLYYVTTAGGPYDGRYSYEYFRELCTRYLGIGETKLLKAEMLDIVGADTEQILLDAEKRIASGQFE